MIRGILEQEHTARQRRVLRSLRTLRRLWFATLGLGLVAAVAVFADYDRPFASRLPKEGLALVINRTVRDNPVQHGSVVRIATTKAYLVTPASALVREIDVGRPIDLWFTWLPRDQTVRGIVKLVRRPEPALNGGHALGLAVIEFDAGPKTRAIDLWPRPVDALRDTSPELWGIDKRTLKPVRLSSLRLVSGVPGATLFTFSAKVGEHPQGAAVVADGRLAGIVADPRADSKPSTPDPPMMAISAQEIGVAVTAAVGR